MVEGDKPVTLTECAAVNALFKDVVDPYAAVVPYSTCELAAVLVVQVTVSLEALTDAALTPEITGGLLTVTETVALVVIFPDASVMTADKTCTPFVAVVVFQVVLYPGPEPVTAVPRLAPSNTNCTLATPALAVAFAETVTVVPRTVALLVGAVIETVDGVEALDKANTLNSSMISSETSYPPTLPYS